MYTKQALRALGSPELSDDQKRQLDESGMLIVENVLSKAQCKEIADEFERLHALEKDTGGKEVHVEPGARRNQSRYLL